MIQKQNKMKKVLSIVAVAALSVAFVACGPSKEEMAAKQKQTEDSLAAVAQAQADSLAKVSGAFGLTNAFRFSSSASITANLSLRSITQ